MATNYRARRLVVYLIVAIISSSGLFAVLFHQETTTQSPAGQSEPKPSQDTTGSKGQLTNTQLDRVAIKGKAQKTGYKRAQFGDGWRKFALCDTRNAILKRDLSNAVVNTSCKVLSGTLSDPYTGKTIMFVRGPSTSADVQIDHVVALSNAWQTGAQQLDRTKREDLANDPLNLLAVDGKANQQKGDGDAATWLPANKQFRCQYVSRQLAVKVKYNLWVTSAEHDAMRRVLSQCPLQSMPTP